jgi:hypothetical protein
VPGGRRNGSASNSLLGSGSGTRNLPIALVRADLVATTIPLLPSSMRQPAGGRKSLNYSELRSIKLLAVTPAGAQFGPPGYECNLLYLACLVALVLSGSGPLSLDGVFSRKR